jgi:hypothetical protein
MEQEEYEEMMQGLAEEDEQAQAEADQAQAEADQGAAERVAMGDFVEL